MVVEQAGLWWAGSCPLRVGFALKMSKNNSSKATAPY